MFDKKVIMDIIAKRLIFIKVHFFLYPAP